MATASDQFQERDLLRNGRFEDGLEGWTVFTTNGADFSVDTVAAGLEISVNGLGENSYDAMLWQLSVPVINGYDYILRFDAWANVESDVTRSFYAKVGKDAANYDTYGGGAFELTNQRQTYEISFEMTQPSDRCAKIEFHLGHALGTLYLDNIELLTSAPEETDTAALSYTTPSKIGEPLRQLAQPLGLTVGAAVETSTFLCNGLHNAVLITEFNAITAANALKMGPLQPQRGQYSWEDADRMVAFAQEHNMLFHGHTLVWHTQQPSWVENESFSREEMLDILYGHIDTVMGRYAGRIELWDVVNEAIEDETYGLRATPWQQQIGDDYIDLAFMRARAADPSAMLLYNDYNIAQQGDRKADAVHEMIEGMVERGIPIDGVGFQMHWLVESPPDPEAIAQNMARYASIGIDVYITEIDVRLSDRLPDSALNDAATVYREMLRVCLEAPNCNHFTTWGISDYDSWIPGLFVGYGRAHLFDENFEAKPAYHALIEALFEEKVDGSTLYFPFVIMR
ncbi:MAG: endo-1,4-beta-xylanase [Chloroflexota bacterium]